MIACGAVGFVAAYMLFYLAYQVYYGSYWPMIDFTASLWISDPALLGAVAGVVYAFRKLKSREVDRDEDTISLQWITLWFLIFVAVAPAAFGQGLFLRLAPQRLVLFIGPPLCLLSAIALQQMALRHPLRAKAWMGLIMLCGVASILVSSLCFQGPLGFTPGKSAFNEYHSAVISVPEAQLLDSLGEGRVITPRTWPPFGDQITLRGNTVVYGLGAWDYSDIPSTTILDIVYTFYGRDSSEATRKGIVTQYCVEWVYCPVNPPQSPEMLDEFRSYDWLEEIDTREGGAVFRVRG